VELEQMGEQFPLRAFSTEPAADGPFCPDLLGLVPQIVVHALCNVVAITAERMTQPEADPHASP
jgi:hypothetical protein